MDIPNYSIKPQFIREFEAPPIEIAPDAYAFIVAQKKTVDPSIDWTAEMRAPASRAAVDVIAAVNMRANNALKDFVADENLLRTYERLLETVQHHPTVHADLPLHAAVQLIQCLPADAAHEALMKTAELGKNLPFPRRSEFFGILFDALGAVPATERLTACEALEEIGKAMPREYHFYAITAEAAALQVLPKMRDRIIIARRLLKRSKALDPRQAMIPLTGLTLTIRNYENGSGQIKLFRQLRKATLHVRNKFGRSGAGPEVMQRVAELYVNQAHQACLTLDEKIFTKRDLKPADILRDSLRNRQLEATVDDTTEKNLRAKIAEDKDGTKSATPASALADDAQKRAFARFQAEAARRNHADGAANFDQEIVLEAEGDGIKAQMPLSNITSILKANPREMRRMEIAHIAEQYVAEHGALPDPAKKLDRTKIDAGLLKIRRLRHPGQPSRANSVQPTVVQSAPLGRRPSRSAAPSGN